MLSVEESQERLLAFFEVLEPETKTVLHAFGQVLSDDVIGSFDIPSADNSAMDGYAIQSGSINAVSREMPMVLKVGGISLAGQPSIQEVTAGIAIRIMTGAVVPKGADAVVPFEDTDEVDRRERGLGLSEIGIFSEVLPGANIRPSGQDVKAGQRVLKKGKVLGEADVGLLASLGFAEVKVIRRPVVSILSTGNELIDMNSQSSPGKIYDSNSYSLGAAVTGAGGLPKLLGIARDDTNSMLCKIEEAMSSDLLITSAGVSKGDYDVVKDVLSQFGKLEFWSVRMRPGKPLAFGVLSSRDGRSLPHLGVPGNPVSALVAFEEFGRPAIYKMLGKVNLERLHIDAILEDPIYNVDRRRLYARVIVSKRNRVYYAKLTGHQGSNLLMSMSLANGLAICPEDVSVMDVGDVVRVKMLSWPEVPF